MTSKGQEPQLLPTALVDHGRYPALDVARLYHERWEFELANEELKAHMLEREEALRSKTSSAIEQEFWGLLIGYNLVYGRICLKLQAMSDCRITE